MSCTYICIAPVCDAAHSFQGMGAGLKQVVYELSLITMSFKNIRVGTCKLVISVRKRYHLIIYMGVGAGRVRKWGLTAGQCSK